jgi:hypothetical protein
VKPFGSLLANVQGALNRSRRFRSDVVPQYELIYWGRLITAAKMSLATQISAEDIALQKAVGDLELVLAEQWERVRRHQSRRFKPK